MVIEASPASRKSIILLSSSLERGKLSTVSTSMWVAGYLGLWYQCKLWILSSSVQKSGSKDLKVVE